MKRIRVGSMVAAAGFLALSGVAIAQQEGDSRSWWGGWGHHSSPCPQPKLTTKKITEDQARDLAQQYAAKNLAGFKVEKPEGYGGGYSTMCYKVDNAGAYQILHSVEYSIDVTTPAGDRRNLRVDQFGNVTPFGGSFGTAGAQGRAGPAGAQGPTGPAGAQGLAGPAGVASVAMKDWTKFRDILFDTDKSDLRSNEMSKVSDIAAYLRQNSSTRVGIDGYADPRGTDKYNQALSERRVEIIRASLVDAGVPGDKIQTGAFGEMRLKCQEQTQACWQSDRRVEVLISTK